jgi:hypothetical protein
MLAETRDRTGRFLLAAALPWALMAMAGCGGGGGSPTGGTISADLQSEYPEIRAKACIRAGDARDGAVIGLLVERLEDPETEVRMLAIDALDRITGQRQGYRWAAGADDRAAAVARWREWLRARAGIGPTSGPSGGQGGQ